MENRKAFAVIDTETNWRDKVMSIGVVIAQCDTYEIISAKYYILAPEYTVGGMYSSALQLEDRQTAVVTRKEAMKNLIAFLQKNNVHSIFAYNAQFDYGRLGELKGFKWFDIMKIAAYRQYNLKIPFSAECFKTGRLKRGYGVEPIMRMLADDYGYYETHNALYDAVDELTIMKLLNLPFDTYNRAAVN